MKSRVPPHNREAEQSVLGAMLFDDRAIGQTVEKLREHHFYDEGHRRIFRAIVGLYNETKPIDLISVSESLRKAGDLESVGGATYLAELLDLVPTVAHVDYYSRIVLEKASLRELAAIATELYGEAMSGNQDPDSLSRAFGDRLIKISVDGTLELPQTIGETLSEALEEIDRRYRAGTSLLGLSTGFPSLDQRTLGFQRGHLTLIGARPSMGKTALMLQMARKQAEGGAHVAVFEIEMSRTDITHRMISNAAGINYRQIQTGENWDQNVDAAREATAGFCSLPFRIDDRTASVERISAISKRLKLRGELDIIYIDYLQIASTSEKTNNRHNEISKMANHLRVLARNLEVPLILLCQLSRAVESRRVPRPQLSDLKESGDLEQIADAVWLLYRPELYRQQEDSEVEREIKNLCEVHFAKLRNGLIGVERLNFFGDHQKFSERYEG